jgi:hypothetical protein
MAWNHSRFGLCTALLAWPLLASLVGCTTASTSPEVGGDDGGSNPFDANGPAGDDAGSAPPDGACSPANVQSYSPRWTPPKPHASSCTSDQIASYAACLASTGPTSAACAEWTTPDSGVNADCAGCIADSNSTDPNWGPIVDTDSVRQLNVAGCMALVNGDTGGTGCAGQYQALAGCESAACATNCTNAVSNQLAACVSEADNGGCSNLLAAAACVNDAGAADVCFGPQNATFPQVFTAVATVFCLATDAGTTDAGTPDAGVGDAGDAGDGG